MSTIWVSGHLLARLNGLEVPVVLFGRAHASGTIVMDHRPNAFLIAVAVAVPAGASPDIAAPVPLVLRSDAESGVCGWRWGGDAYQAAEVRLVSVGRELQARNHGIIGEDRLTLVSVMVVGAGSQGSLIARPLVQAGVGTVRIGDGDLFSPENVSRHALAMDAVGMGKAVALADHLRLVNPSLATEVIDVPLNAESRDAYRAIFASSDLVIVATDSRAANLLAQELLSELGKPGIFVGVWERAEAAEVIYSDPANGTACYGCIRDALPGPDRPEPGAQPYALARTDEPSRPEPGLGVDVNFVASVAARLALDVLTDRLGGLLAPGQSALLVSTKQTDLFEQACQVSPLATVPDPDCWHCAAARWAKHADGGCDD